MIVACFNIPVAGLAAKALAKISINIKSEVYLQ
jgi:hypothetical protein